MISRRNIRVKVMQALYTLDSTGNDTNIQEAGKLLRKQIEQSRKLLVGTQKRQVMA